MVTKKGKTVLMNTLHKGFVYTCVGATLVGLVMVGQIMYQFVTVRSPQRKQMLLEELDLEKDLSDFPEPAGNVTR